MNLLGGVFVHMHAESLRDRNPEFLFDRRPRVGEQLAAEVVVSVRLLNKMLTHFIWALHYTVPLLGIVYGLQRTLPTSCDDGNRLSAGAKLTSFSRLRRFGGSTGPFACVDERSGRGLSAVLLALLRWFRLPCEAVARP